MPLQIGGGDALCSDKYLNFILKEIMMELRAGGYIMVGLLGFGFKEYLRQKIRRVEWLSEDGNVTTVFGVVYDYDL